MWDSRYRIEMSFYKQILGIPPREHLRNKEVIKKMGSGKKQLKFQGQIVRKKS